MGYETRTRSIGSVPMYTDSGETHIVQFKVSEGRTYNEAVGVWSEWRVESKQMSTEDSAVNLEPNGDYRIASNSKRIFAKSLLPDAALGL